MAATQICDFSLGPADGFQARVVVPSHVPSDDRICLGLPCFDKRLEQTAPECALCCVGRCRTALPSRGIRRRRGSEMCSECRAAHDQVSTSFFRWSAFNKHFPIVFAPVDVQRRVAMQYAPDSATSPLRILHCSKPAPSRIFAMRVMEMSHLNGGELRQ